MSESPITAGTVTDQAPPISVSDLAKALGPATVAPIEPQAVTIQPSAPDPGARMRLIGVVAGRTSGGVALISIDGQFARPYRVGSQIDDAYRLTKVAKRSATLSPMQSAGVAITLELPATATLDAAPPPFGVGGPISRRFDALPTNPAIATPPAGEPERSLRD